jgi:hypothetical protein
MLKAIFVQKSVKSPKILQGWAGGVYRLTYGSGLQISPSAGPENAREQHSSGWTRHGRRDAMVAAVWSLSAVAGCIPASLSLTLLIATLVYPSPFPQTLLLRPLFLLLAATLTPSPSRAQVSILVLGAAAVFFEHIRKIGCMHS